MPKPSKRSGDDQAVTDPRFANLAYDPRFRLPSKKHSKVQLDTRFAGLLKDDDFSKKAKVDRYGRKVESESGRKELSRMYRLDESSGDDNSADEENKSLSGGEEKVHLTDGSDDTEDEGSSETDPSDTEESAVDVKSKGYDPAREGGFSASEDESESDEDSDLEDDNETVAAALQEEIEEGEVTSRIAVVNMDWDFIRSEDIMAVASSFASNGQVLKVEIYSSEFGRERLVREEVEGPPRELFQSDRKNKKKRNQSDSGSESDDGSDSDSPDPADEPKTSETDFSSTKLRQYQLERLRYYYAVITTSSVDVGREVYESMDGREYLASANFFDLRFVPDDVTFDDDPRDECLKLPAGYKPREFVTQALRHSKVKLGWDADETSRVEVMKKAFSRDDQIENDLQAYLATDSSEDEDEVEERKAAARRHHRLLLGVEDSDSSDSDGGAGKTKQEKANAFRSALGLGDSTVEAERKKQAKSSNRPKGNMEVTFVPALAPENADAKDGTTGVFVNQPETETTVEKYVRKQRERKARRKNKGKEGDEDGQDDEPAEQADSKPDLGFNDPFFQNPEKVAREEAQKAKKTQKEQKQREAEKMKAEKDREARQLKLLMADESRPDGTAIAHFDIKDVLKQEKAAGRKGSKTKGKRAKKDAEPAAAAAQDDFQMDVKDDRFGALFDSHDFAIDPTNPRFMATKGMKTLMDERRKKRKAGDDSDLPLESAATVAARPTDKRQKTDELRHLVDQVKRKSVKTSKR